MPYYNLINMNGRIYDPVTGRFISVDNNVADLMNSQAWNKYLYCYNNPLRYTDPSGWRITNNTGCDILVIGEHDEAITLSNGQSYDGSVDGFQNADGSVVKISADAGGSWSDIEVNSNGYTASGFCFDRGIKNESDFSWSDLNCNTKHWGDLFSGSFGSRNTQPCI